MDIIGFIGMYDKTDLLFEHFKLTMEMIKGQYPKNIKILKK